MVAIESIPTSVRAAAPSAFVCFSEQVNASSSLTVKWSGGSAVSGILGAYPLLHPKVRVIVLLFYRIPLPLPAFIVLGGWVGLQIYNVFQGGGLADADGGGTAWWAHIGGFAAGMLLILVMKRKNVPLFDRGRY